MSDPHDPMDGVERRLAELYRSGAAEQPSAEIDRRILAAARDAAPRGRRRWPLAGLATAAAAVLAVSVLLRLLPEPDPWTPPAPPPAVMTSQAAAEAHAETRQRAQASDRAALARSAPSPAPVLTATPADAVRYASPACPDPYPLPPGAVIRPLDGGIEVTDGDERFTLHCRGGRWQRADEGAVDAERGAPRP